ncbi:helix-turn-helix domain-containing protein [Labrys neptuniae]
MKTVPAQTVGRYRERTVPAALAETFVCCWQHQLPEFSMPAITITPDAAIDLQWIDGRFRIAGPDRSAIVEAPAPGSTVIGFRFQPAAASVWLGVPACELADQRLDLEDLWGSRAPILAEMVEAEQNGAGLIGGLETALARTTFRPTSDAAMTAAFRLVERGPPTDTALLPFLEEALGISTRTLRRRFDASFGYGPKTLDRILRFRRFQRLLRGNRRSSMASLAVEAGYADQAHLIRESQRLFAGTPAQLARTLGAGLPDATP